MNHILQILVLTIMKLKNKALLKNKAYINGQWISANNKTTFSVENPYDQSSLTEVADIEKQQISEAINYASEAMLSWKAKSATERSVILKKWYQLQIDNADDLALILSLEQGKPLTEAKAEINYGASYVEWFAEEAKRTYGDVIPGNQPNNRIMVIKQPIGVVCTITPWNFPNAMINRKVAPALAAGCTVVIKPSEITPLSALALAELAHQAGIPPGVLNIVTSSNAAMVGDEFTANPTVKKISFTGSTRVGKILMEKSAANLKKLSLELGGNAPFIVLNDADIPAAVLGAIAAKFRNAGQTCIAANRIFVHNSIYDVFVKQFSEAVKALKVGNGLISDNQIGPLINKVAVDKVTNIVNDAIKKGAHIITGGKTNTYGENFFDPTIITNINKTMRVYHEEVFGPIAPIIKFTTDAEVIAMANDTEYGLAAYFYGNNLQRVWQIAEALDYGMVGVNTGMISTPVAPFGGVKESGIGREGSKYGIDDYMILKYISLGNM